ncbi:uncharacterized protein CLV86_2421 [Lacinutrix venerupis]|uniref:TPM domain-containing protein n=1 Tax=Lacinutrix venerupis TaxID=1486034 RepID=UPI000EB12749|nr:TPM domain-containing protein [Lacinutrix venerupis]RLJ62024.1 uncharacterized protein CLV86_2421 [Lacinutrix venerupis]
MKNLVIISIILLLISCKQNNPKTIVAIDVVQDYSQLFSAEEKQTLSEKIINYEKETTNQICVYTIDSLPQNTNSLYYATNLAMELGVGTKDKNNGLLLLISKYDRKIAIATGTETEKTITDLIANEIITTTIVPKFKENLYFKGVSNSLDSIIKKWN